MAEQKYPLLEVNLKAVRHNTETLVSLLSRHEISLTGVVKGFNSLPKVVDQFVEGGCRHLASSRLEHLARMKRRGIELPLMLLRIPMLSEIEDLIQEADISLNSERKTVEALAEACSRRGCNHGVVLMQDLGDLREGYMEPGELIELAVHIEKNLKSLTLKGVGTNLGCYGAVRPSVDNLGRLVETAREIEKRIGRPLEIVSGGATSSLPLLLEGRIPAGINNLRVGEGILNNRDLPDFWNVIVPGLKTETFILRAQVVEKKVKPSHPIGEVFIDAFGNTPVYVDRGFRNRAILAVGKADFCDPDKLVPLNPGVEIVGASSDHLIVDIENCIEPVEVGTILSFGMYYSPMLFLSASQSVSKVYNQND